LDHDHRARIVDAFVDGLDRAILEETYLGVGSLAHTPDLMLKIVLYEFVESRPTWMATTPAGRQRHLEKFKQAAAELATRLDKDQKRPKDKRLPSKHVRISPNDPEAPLGRDKEKVFCPFYTAEFVVAPESLLILSFNVFAQATDAGTLAPMLDRTEEVTGRMLDQIDTDAGYASLLDLQSCQERGVQLVAPVNENDFTERKRAKAGKATIGKDQFQWLPQEQTYACPIRGSVIERYFGDAKEHRNLRRLHGNGLARAKSEVGLLVLAQTALMLARLRRLAASPTETAA